MRLSHVYVLLQLMLFWGMSAFPANVIWDHPSIYFGGDTTHFRMTQPALGHEPGEYWSLDLTLVISQLGADQYTLTGGDPNLLFSGNWVKPDGDNVIVCEDTTRHLSKYLIHQFIDDPSYEGETFPETSITVVADESFYLMFCLDTNYPNLEVIYGWVQLRMEDDGTISYLHSAYDLDGGPMIVGGGAWEGGIPEPSGGILFLLGVAALGLRRRGRADLDHTGTYFRL